MLRDKKSPFGEGAPLFTTRTYPNPPYLVFNTSLDSEKYKPNSTMSLLNNVSIPPPKEEIMEGYKRVVLIPELQQMMFVAGETGEPSGETTTLIEQIVHEQVIEMVSLSIYVCVRG